MIMFYLYNFQKNDKIRDVCIVTATKDDYEASVHFTWDQSVASSSNIEISIVTAVDIQVC